MRGTARCRVRVLSPVDPATFAGDVPAFREHVRALIMSEKQRLDAEVAPRTAQ